jgi:oligoribonuclease (3'-5' exoribonuclease)
LKYLSIDIETTGVDPLNDQILSVGAIVEDTSIKSDFKDLPKIHLILKHDRINGNPYAIQMNNSIIRYISGKEKPPSLDDEKFGYTETIDPSLLESYLIHFIQSHMGNKKVVAAGKNFGSFDFQFLKQHGSLGLFFAHRSIDPAMMYIDWNEDYPPNLETCKEKAGLPKLVSHNALEDAWDVIQCLRKFY